LVSYLVWQAGRHVKLMVASKNLRCDNFLIKRGTALHTWV